MPLLFSKYSRLKSLKCCFLLFFLFSFYQSRSQYVDENYVNSINVIIEYVNKTSTNLSAVFFIINNAYFWTKEDETKASENFSRHIYAGASKSEYSVQDLYTQAYMIRTELDQSHAILIQTIDSINLIYKKIVNCAFEMKDQLLSRRYLQDDFRRFYQIAQQANELYKTYYRLLNIFRKETHTIALKLLDKDPERTERFMEMNMRAALDFQLPLMYKWSLYLNQAERPMKLMKENYEFTEKEFMSYEKTPDIEPALRFHYLRFYSYLRYENQNKKKAYIEIHETGTTELDTFFVPWGLISAFVIRCSREFNQYTKEARKIGIHMLDYVYEPYLFIFEPDPEPKDVPDESIITEIKISSDTSYSSMDGYAINHLVLLLDVSGSMNDEDKLPLLKSSFKRLLNILRPEDLVSIVVFSGKAQQVLKPTSGTQIQKIIHVLDNLESKGSTNITDGLELAFSTAENDYIAKGNNRIILATDGQFELDKELYKLTKNYSKKDIRLSVFHFGKKQNDKDLQKLAGNGKGNYEIITVDNVAIKLIKEAKAVKLRSN